MGDHSKIEWTEATWNPVVGCSKVSPGCAHCYAEELHRTRLDGSGAYPPYKPWTPENAEHNVTLVPERLDQPLRWRRPRMVFVNSMSDLFHELVPDRYIEDVLNVMLEAKQHTFQVLTKRPERMRDFLSARIASDRGPRNVWWGTSIENRRFVHRADALRETPAAVRFISAEPLLGPLAYDRSIALDEDGLETEWEWADGYEGDGLDLDGIHWLIVGGESGPRHRPIRREWVADLRDLAIASHTAFFFKQWGGRTPKAGGRELDGRTWDEMPSRERVRAVA